MPSNTKPKPLNSDSSQRPVEIEEDSAVLQQKASKAEISGELAKKNKEERKRKRGATKGGLITSQVAIGGALIGIGIFFLSLFVPPTWPIAALIGTTSVLTAATYAAAAAVTYIVGTAGLAVAIEVGTRVFKAAWNAAVTVANFAWNAAKIMSNYLWNKTKNAGNRFSNWFRERILHKEPSDEKLAIQYDQAKARVAELAKKLEDRRTHASAFKSPDNGMPPLLIEETASGKSMQSDSDIAVTDKPPVTITIGQLAIPVPVIPKKPDSPKIETLAPESDRPVTIKHQLHVEEISQELPKENPPLASSVIKKETAESLTEKPTLTGSGMGMFDTKHPHSKVAELAKKFDTPAAIQGVSDNAPGVGLSKA